MNQDVEFTEKMLRLCVLLSKKNKVSNESLTTCFSFTTKDDINYVLFGQPYAESQSVIIARNDNNDDVNYPNGVLFMDGFWFGADPVECKSVMQELDSQFSELNTEFLAEKLDKLVRANLLPMGLKIL